MSEAHIGAAPVSASSVSAIAWSVVLALVDPVRRVVFCERARAEAEIATALARLVGARQRDDVALISSRCAAQLRGPGERCICGEARVHEIVRDTLEYALGRRESQFALSAVRVGVLARINASRRAARRGAAMADGAEHPLATSVTPLAFEAAPAELPGSVNSMAACGWCGESFVKHRHGQRFCSASCRVMACRGRGAAGGVS